SLLKSSCSLPSSILVPSRPSIIVPYGADSHKLEPSNLFFHLAGQRTVVLARECDWLAKRDADRARVRHLPGLVKHLLEPLDSDRDDRDPKTRGNHANPRTKRIDLAGVCHFAFGKDQHRDSVLHHLPDVTQRLPGSRFILRERERIEEERREIVV